MRECSAPVRTGIGREMRSNTNSHIDDAALESYAMRALRNDDATAVETHLLVCQICCDRLTETDAYLRAVRSAAKSYPLEIAVEDDALSEK